MALIYANDFAQLKNVLLKSGLAIEGGVPFGSARPYPYAVKAQGLSPAPVLGTNTWLSSFVGWSEDIHTGSWASSIFRNDKVGLVLLGETRSPSTYYNEYSESILAGKADATQFRLPLPQVDGELYINLCLSCVSIWTEDQIGTQDVPPFMAIGYDYVTIDKATWNVVINGQNTGKRGMFTRAQPVKQQYDIRITQTETEIWLDGNLEATIARESGVPVPQLEIYAHGRDCSQIQSAICIHSVVVSDNSGTTFNTFQKRLRVATTAPNATPDSVQTQAFNISASNSIANPVEEMTDNLGWTSYYLDTVPNLKNTFNIIRPDVPGTIKHMAIQMQSRVMEPNGTGFTVSPFVNIRGVEYAYKGTPQRARWDMQMFPVAEVTDFSFTNFKIGFKTDHVNTQQAFAQKADKVDAFYYPRRVYRATSQNPWLSVPTLLSDFSAITNTSYIFWHEGFEWGAVQTTDLDTVFNNNNNLTFQSQGAGWLGNGQTSDYQQVLNTSYRQTQ